MDKKTVEEMETRFIELLQKPPYPIDEMLALMAEVPSSKAEEWALLLLQAFVEAVDFAGAWKLVQAQKDVLGAKLGGAGICDALKKTTRDRLVLSLIDSVGFGKRSVPESVARLERLLSFVPGALVLSSAWGLGEVRRLDYFYRRMTVDFRTRKGHQLTFDAACETLLPAPGDHLLVTAKADPARIDKMLKENPGDFVKEMLRSFGDMPVTRLEELSAQHGFVKSANWKAFWERARADLRKDKLVEIPTRRAEPLHLKATAETYGEGWFTAFAQMKEPKSILSSVRELQGTGRIKGLDDAQRAKIAERLAFALKGARGADDALYARIAFCLDDLKLDPALASKARNYLWSQNRYLLAARTLPARETGALVVFLTAENREETKKAVFAALPEMCFSFLSETLEFFRNDADCEEAVAALLRTPHPPATLVTYVLARYGNFAQWRKLPPLVVILTHAIAIGEGRQSGETLRMQNMVHRLFSDAKWLGETFGRLSDSDREIVFERFQASIAWDPSTHHVITVRMTKIDPRLAAYQVKKEVVRPAERITSRRSYAERKAAYLKLINEDMPKNAHDIEVARSYGDLRENFEYQSAKDEQRALLQKQSVMQEELDQVKAVDFADVVPDEVRPGTMVCVALADGSERVYTILGEWDNDLEKNILSNRTKLAENMMGKKPGETFDLPDAEGTVSAATIKTVSALSDEMRAWTAVPPGFSI